jgi:hypothetical protein
MLASNSYIEWGSVGEATQKIGAAIIHVASVSAQHAFPTMMPYFPYHSLPAFAHDNRVIKYIDYTTCTSNPALGLRLVIVLLFVRGIPNDFMDMMLSDIVHQTMMS